MKPKAVYFYIRGKTRAEAQREKLQAEFPQGQAVIDTRPPEMLERLIAGAGPGDLIAVTSIEAIPEITAEDYIKLCSAGAGLHIQQQPCLDSAIFAPEIAQPQGGEVNRQSKRTAARIIERQLAAERDRQQQQRAKEKAGRDAAKAEGRPGGRRAGEPQTTRKEIALQGKIRELMAQGLTGPQMLEKLNASADGPHISHNTLYKYMRTLKAQEAGGDQTGEP